MGNRWAMHDDTTLNISSSRNMSSSSTVDAAAETGLDDSDVTSVDYAVFGLGNEGCCFDNTRHNIGFHIVDELARKHQLHFKLDKSLKCYHTPFERIGSNRFMIAKPTTFMNLSGGAVKAVVQRFNIQPEHVLVVHDEIAFEGGTIKVKTTGSSGGHNGVQSVLDKLTQLTREQQQQQQKQQQQKQLQQQQSPELTSLLASATNDNANSQHKKGKKNGSNQSSVATAPTAAGPPAFVRVRVGVGQKQPVAPGGGVKGTVMRAVQQVVGVSLAQWVLQKYTTAEVPWLPTTVHRTISCLELIVGGAVSSSTCSASGGSAKSGLSIAMNRYNMSSERLDALEAKEALDAATAAAAVDRLNKQQREEREDTKRRRVEQQ